MEVMMPSSPIMDFDSRSSPRSITAPSTPRRLGDCFFSAPTSPARLSEFYREFDRFSMMSDAESSRLTVPFDWEEKPGTPRSKVFLTIDDDGDDDDDDDFAFNFSAASEETSRPAEELFDGGKIKPLKPPPRLKADDYDQKSPLLSSPFSQGKKMIREAFSPRKQKELVQDPFATAIETSRGRERVQDFSLKNSSRRATRSLSPYRVSDQWENDEPTTSSSSSKQSSSAAALNSKQSFSSNSSKGSSSRKWRLRDFLLFRSASEGRAADKDPLRKYSMFFKRHDHHQDQNKKINSSTSSSKSTDRSRRKVSAHELHYTTNKAVSENMKKKTFLPYKQVILGRLAFHADGFGK